MKIPPRPVLIVNHWGGVPRCLHGNLLSLQTWAKVGRTRVTLPDTNGEDAFWEMTGEMWKALKREGKRTACFGCTGRRERRKVRHERDSLPDPRRDLEGERGIETCSPRDGADFEGLSLLHDELTVEEAISFLQREGEGGEQVVVCVSLLSCADIPRSRFQRRDVSDPKRECCVLTHVTPPSSMEERKSLLLLPPSLGVRVEGVSDRFSALNHSLYGEEAEEVKEEEYVALVERATTCLLSVQTILSPLIALVLSLNGHICMMGSSSFSLGEYGCRDGDAPISSCGRTFFCSTREGADGDSLSPFSSATHCLSAFVEEACGLREGELTRRRQSSLTVSCRTRRDGALFHRVDVSVRSHNYMCLLREDELIRVHDVDEDPLETKDVLRDLHHVMENIVSSLEDMLGRKVTLPPPPAPSSVHSIGGDEKNGEEEEEREEPSSATHFPAQRETLATSVPHEVGGGKNETESERQEDTTRTREGREEPLPGRRRGPLPQNARVKERRMSAMRDR